jgi:phosphoribosylformimino-5-aminoimidazole carboxamide ribotide isomerase
LIVIPAIDLKEGKCVRLLQGRMEDATVYSDNPEETAKRWEAEGAELLHIVDLDGAFTGGMKNISAIEAIRKAIRIPIEVGGGIRDMDRIEKLLSLGVNRIILGTVAVEKPELVKEVCKKYPDKILIGIDAKNGFVATKGWVEVTKVKAKELALMMQGYDAAGIIYTDISKDGMLTGPNIETTRDMVESLNIPVIASGGISSVDDIRRLSGIKGLWGAITGKAIYSGTLNLKEAIKVAKDAC